MTSTEKSFALTASCVHCQGAVPLAIAGPPVGCPYCGSADPLDAALKARLAELRERLRSRAQRLGQLDARKIEKLQGFGSTYLVLVATGWLFFGGWALVLSLAETPPLGDFLAGRWVAAPGLDELSAKWWLLWGLVTGALLSLAALGFGTAIIRGLGAEALPFPAAAPGGAPRCRCCGGELAGPGRVVRCAACGADNLLLGERYRRVDQELDQALQGIARRFGSSLDARIRGASRLGTVASVLPAALMIFLFPIGGLVRSVAPVLWVVPLLLTVPAALGWVWAFRRKLPTVHSIEHVLPGDLVSLLGGDGQTRPYRVDGFVEIDGAGPGRRLLLLSDNGRGGRERALLEVSRVDGQLRFDLSKLAPGGDPLSTDEAGRAIAVRLCRRTGGAPTDAGRGRLVERGGNRKWAVWEGEPAVGASPLWTVSLRSGKVLGATLAS